VNNKSFTTACGLATMAFNFGMPAIAVATTARNEATIMYCFPISNTNAVTLEEPSNYFSVEQQPDILTVSDVIQQADKTLGLSKQHLAKVFLTSRQNLYNLLNKPDQKPNQETENRAKQVNEALKVVSAICPNRLGASTLTVRIDDKRLFDVLTSEHINLEQVAMFSKAIAKRINKQSQPTLPKHITKQEEFLNRPNAV
jgi:transposase